MSGLLAVIVLIYIVFRAVRKPKEDDDWQIRHRHHGGGAWR